MAEQTLYLTPISNVFNTLLRGATNELRSQGYLSAHEPLAYHLSFDAHEGKNAVAAYFHLKPLGIKGEVCVELVVRTEEDAHHG